MIYNMYSIFDRKSEHFAPPFIARTDDEAIRFFKTEYDNALRTAPSSALAMFVADYEVDRVGQFDDLLGKVIAPDQPMVQIFSGSSLLPPTK